MREIPKYCRPSSAATFFYQSSMANGVRAIELNGAAPHALNKAERNCPAPPYPTTDGEIDRHEGLDLNEWNGMGDEHVTRRSILDDSASGRRRPARPADGPRPVAVAANKSGLSVTVVEDLTDLERYVPAWEDLAA